MRGARLARHALCDHLNAHLNGDIGQLIEQGYDVEPVQEWHPSWVPGNRVEKWPVLMVTSHHGVNLGRTDWDAGDPRHRWNWTVRAWLWARGDNYEQTADRVELAAAATTNVLLGRPALGDPDDGMYVLDTPITVSLSDIEPDRKMRASIAGAYVECVVTMAETATADPPWGPANTIDLAVEPKDP